MKMRSSVREFGRFTPGYRLEVNNAFRKQRQRASYLIPKCRARLRRVSRQMKAQLAQCVPLS
jgi:hypothetical protein